MPCWGPITAYHPPATSEDRRLVFKKERAGTGVAIKVPCGRCSGCRLEHSRQWAVRCMHEKRLHNASAFLTLTYNDDNIPSGNSLSKRDLQLFLKRTRKELGSGLRFFACGEYGETTARPHYHVLLLSNSFTDLTSHRLLNENKLYTSKTLAKLWPVGHHMIGDVTFESAAYVARYCMKKITGKKAETHYNGRQPEFITMSRKPGLGTGYFDKYYNELLNHDAIIVNGHPAALPRFYDGKINELLPDDKIGLYTRAELIKIKRRRKITKAQRLDNTSARLRVRELVSEAKLKLKKRTL
ncbi:MAG: replication initiator protein [Microvirus sp.]|nr:MAG: replication initiator protein [Microvirus sp.]